LRTAPVIVDEESAVPESVIIACQEAQKGGLLASSDYGNLLASMSGYEKPPSYGYGMLLVLPRKTFGRLADLPEGARLYHGSDD
jgi:hypothetical protein